MLGHPAQAGQSCTWGRSAPGKLYGSRLVLLSMQLLLRCLVDFQHPIFGWLGLKGTLPKKREKRAPRGNWVCRSVFQGQSCFPALPSYRQKAPGWSSSLRVRCKKMHSETGPFCWQIGIPTRPKGNIGKQQARPGVVAARGVTANKEAQNGGRRGSCRATHQCS